MPGHEQRPYRCVLGLRNSYDKSVSTGVCIGASVFVCDNLSFNGEVTFSRKHTTNLMRDLSWLIVETISRLPGKFAAQSEAFDAYQNAHISDFQAHDLIIRMVDEGVINVGDIRNVLKESREPRHPQFAERGKTAWRLFNATTEAIKGDLWRLPVRTTKLHSVLDGLAPTAARIALQPGLAEGQIEAGTCDRKGDQPNKETDLIYSTSRTLA